GGSAFFGSIKLGAKWPGAKGKTAGCELAHTSDYEESLQTSTRRTRRNRCPISLHAPTPLMQKSAPPIACSWFFPFCLGDEGARRYIAHTRFVMSARFASRFDRLQGRLFVLPVGPGTRCCARSDDRAGDSELDVLPHRMMCLRASIESQWQRA